MMQRHQITAIFDQQAATYDQKWGHLAALNQALHLLANAVFSRLPAQAHLLCVGAGTGNEILAFAQRFPGWRFTAVEPSVPMLDVLHRRVEEQGIASRCTFHAGYLDTLPPSEPFDAATAFLVSQFILDRPARSRFFQAISNRLLPDGILICSDLAGDLSCPECQALLEIWYTLTSGNSVTPEGVARMRETYGRDVAVVLPNEVRDIISRGGFQSPVQFFQAGMIHAWFAARNAIPPDAV
jgi:tRNA (cmo5U34)-methyltransferase